MLFTNYKINMIHVLNFSISNLDLLLDLIALLLALLIIIVSNKGLLSEKLHRFCKYNSKTEFVSIFIIISALILFILNVFFVILSYFLIDLKFDMITMVNNSSSSNTTNVTNINSQDPVRWLPSGTTQSWACLGAAVALYRTIPGTPKIKATAALTSLGVTIPMSIFSQIVENPNGFNKFMFSYFEYKRTNRWPLLAENRVITDNQLDPIITKVTEEANNNPVVNQAQNLLPNDVGNSISHFINDTLNMFLMYLSQSAPVEGYLDDLIGQQLIIYILLLIVVISTIFLFLVYLFVLFILSNKDYFLTRFNNKYINFFIRYQLFLSKLSLFILPIFIMIGLLQLLIGIYFLVTHMIPYDSLGIDLHKYVSNKNL